MPDRAITKLGSGTFVSQAGATLFPGTSEIGSLSYPLTGIAIITLFSAVAIFFAVPNTNRIGAASRAAKVNNPVYLIKILSRWSSSAYRR